MYKYKNKLTVKKGMKRYVARRSRIIRNNIDRKMFYDDFLETPTITRPLPDKVTKRDFDTQAPAPQDVDLSAFDFEPFPVTQKNIAR